MKTQTRWIIWLIVAAAFFWFLFAVKAILLPFVIGMLLAYSLDPAADKLEAWGCSRFNATVIITLVFFIVMSVALILLVPLIIDQLGRLVTVLPSYIQTLQSDLQPQLDKWAGFLHNNVHTESSNNAFASISEEILKVSSDLLHGVLRSGVALVNLVSLLFITPVVAFYLLKDWDRITARIDDLLPRAYADTIRTQIRHIDETLAGFVRGQINVILIMMLYNTVGLTLVGLNFSVIIGIVSGFLVIIPYIGTVISALLAVGMAYVQFDSWQPIVLVAAIFVGGQILEGNFLTPKMVGEKVGLHPVWVIFGMLAGAALFGFVGIFLAVPVTAVIGVLVRFAIEQYHESSLYSDAPQEKKA